MAYAYGIRPWEFGRMTPFEIVLTLEARERLVNQAHLQIAAFLAAEIRNAAGRYYKKGQTPSAILPEAFEPWALLED